MANPSATTALKLRDSCDACAASKVKCHKQKPTCSRCQRRGTACHYLVTKRAGRRVDSVIFSPGAASKTQWEHFDLDSWLSTSSTMSSTHSNDDEIFLQQLLTPTASSAGTKSIQPSAPNFISIEPNDDIFMGQSMSTVTTPCTPSNSLGPGSGGVSPVNLAMDLDDYFPSSISLWAPKNHETSTLDALPPLDLGAESQSSSSDVNNTLHDTCIARATRIMQQQFHQASTESSNNSCTLSEQDRMNSSSGPTLDLVIESNKEYINQVDAMLQCQCLHDGYLLTMLSLVVFKVLDSYQAAASSPGVEKTNLDAMEDDAQRRAAQRVMGELHRVQRLVNQLSVNIKRHTATGPQERTTGALILDGQKEESETSLPFSRVMLGQLETDMRKRLRSLSLGMGIHLRRD